MLSSPWLQDDWDRKDVRLLDLAASPFRLPHLDEVVAQIPLEEGLFSILGPRQVGKSTLLRLFAKKALSRIPAVAMVLIEGDAVESWRELQSLLTDFLSRPAPAKLRAILIDEITGIPEWHRAVKLLADRGDLRGVLLLYTGSSVSSLKEGGELLPGRRGRQNRMDFEVMPVSFRHVAKVLSLEDYFKVGGFPWSVNEYLRLGAVPPYVGEIYWSWLKGEFLKRGKSDLVLKHIAMSLAKRTRTPMSLNKLSQEVGVASHETARQYVQLLQDCFALRELIWMSPQQKEIAPRKNRKYYPIDPLLYHLFCGGGFYTWTSEPLGPDTAGTLAELTVCGELVRRMKKEGKDIGYWMGKREIDFMPAPIEVKYQNRVIPEEFDWFRKSFPKSELLVLTKNDSFVRDGVRAMPLKEWLLKT